MGRTETRNERLSLTECRSAQRCRVVEISENKRAVISSFGIYPGVEILVKQTRPAYVIQFENSEIALERTLAQTIRVECLV